jgi:hypothetical protein
MKTCDTETYMIESGLIRIPKHLVPIPHRLPLNTATFIYSTFYYSTVGSVNARVPHACETETVSLQRNFLIGSTSWAVFGIAIPSGPVYLTFIVF